MIVFGVNHRLVFEGFVGGEVTLKDKGYVFPQEESSPKKKKLTRMEKKTGRLIFLRDLYLDIR